MTYTIANVRRYQFSRPLTAAEALTLERSLVAWGSRLDYSPDGFVVGAICASHDLQRWLTNSGVKALTFKVVG